MRLLAVVLVTVLGCWPVRRPRIASRQIIEPDRARSAPNVRGLLDRVTFGPLLEVSLFISVGLVVGSPLLVVAGPIVAVGIWRERARQARRRLHDDRSMAMLDFAESTVAGLRAGGSLSTAVVSALEHERLTSADPAQAGGSVRTAHHGHPGLGQVGAGLAAGRTLSASFADAFGDDSVSSDDRLVATTIAALHGSGASAVDALERVGDTLRERHAWHEDLRTQAQQALSSAAVMSALPLVFGIAAALADAGVSELYRTRWLGALCAGSAVLLGMIGWEWQQRLLGASR